MTSHATANNPAIRQQAKLMFLETLKAGYSVGYSAEQAGVDRSTVYEWQASDADFASQWASCYERGSDWAEDKLRDRVEAGNVDATLAMLRIRRRLVPDAAPPAIQIAVVWQGQLPPGPPGEPPDRAVDISSIVRSDTPQPQGQLPPASPEPPAN